MTILQVALPMAAVLAAIYTIRALARSRGETASTR
jgi:lipopolysaccharide export LptBFGC system permease protein LptF